MQAFRNAKAYFEETLTCCELMDASTMECVKQHMGLDNPVDGDYEYFLLLEYSTKKAEENVEAILTEYLELIGESARSFMGLDSESIRVTQFYERNCPINYFLTYFCTWFFLETLGATPWSWDGGFV